MDIIKTRAGEPANFFAALAPDFFPKRLRLLVFFFERLRLQGAKNTRLRLIGKIFFSPQTSKVKLQKNNWSKIIVSLTIKLDILPKEE